MLQSLTFVVLCCCINAFKIYRGCVSVPPDKPNAVVSIGLSQTEISHALLFTHRRVVVDNSIADNVPQMSFLAYIDDKKAFRAENDVTTSFGLACDNSPLAAFHNLSPTTSTIDLVISWI